jgi:formylglycine-generating enzyme required for sulfatase activity
MNLKLTRKISRLLALVLLWSSTFSVSQAGTGFAVTGDVTVITRYSDANLSSLTLSSGTLSPSFSSSTTSYTASVPNATSSITVTPSTTNAFATVRVNGTLVTSGAASQSISLSVGSNTISVVGTAEDGTTTSTYTVVVTRISNVASLSSLALSTGTLSPAFTSSTSSYTASVPNATSSITVIPTTSNAFASVQVNGTLVTSGAASQSIPLNVGGNTITVRGTAQDGTTTSTYTVVVTRISNVASLSSLALSNGTLSPAFTSSTSSYTASVPNATSSITVTPSTTNSFATVQVNGTLVSSGSASQSVPLNVGSNTITVRGTAQDGTTTTTYTVAVTRFSNVSTLSALTLSSGTLGPGFATNTTTYSAIVANSITSITVRPTLTAATATVRVNGTLVTSGTTSQSIPLSLGSNTISIIGTAQDDTITSTYTLTVWKYQCTLVDAGIAEGGNLAMSWNAVDIATLTATPKSGYLFGAWTDDASGSANPTTVLMDADKTVGATFVQDTRDPDSDGLTNFQEIITHSTDPDLADTDGDGITDGTEVAQGRSPKTAEPVVTNLIGTQRQGTKLVDISYDLASVASTVNVTLEISQDGGLTYSVPVNSTTGAIGNSVTVGSGKTIVWNAGDDWDGNFSNQMLFRLIADDLQVPGFSMIPAGAFTMGRTSGDTDTNAPPVNVTVSQFYMGKYEVTKAEWDEVRAWAVNKGYTDLAAGAGKASNHPVQTVSWWDVIKWCNARSEKEGLTPCYTVSGSVMKTGSTAPTVNWTANGYRLPTEAEWEKAARGGVSGKRFPWGEDTISHNEANFNNSGTETYKTGTTGYHPTYGVGSMPYTSPVGSFAGNGYRLHDMAGNVWEWCWDWYGATSYVNSATDPRGAASGTVRVYRGGSWYDVERGCRAALRGNGTASGTNFSFGFRVARSIATMGGNSFAISSQDSVVDVRNFILSIAPLTNGAVAGDGSYLSGLSSNLTATPQPGYLFGAWTGDASGSDNPAAVVMDSDKTVGATFVQDTRDPDSDGLTNYQEIIVRLTNPDISDTDSDGVNDGQEVTDATNPLIADTDDDGLNDGEEKTRSTNPLVTDTDGDGYSDSYEVNNGVDPTKDTSFPTYILTLANNGTVTGGTFAKTGTLAHGTNATVTATPLSGYLFGSWSGAASGSNNPNTVLMNSNKTVGATFVEDTRDPDSDGLTNYQEIIVRLTNPNVADSDSDGVNDGQEITDATNPLVADTDDDGLNDGEEKTRSTNPLVTDTDGDGYSDSYEVNNDADPTKDTSFPTYILTLANNGTVTGGTFAKTGTLAHGTNATVTATPLSGYLFGSWSGAASGSNNPNTVLMNSNKTVGATFVEDTRDPDSDGLTNYQEIIVRLTNPNVADSDSDGVNDGQEVIDATNPLVADTDGDGLNDGEEKTRNTNPLAKDTDGDGLSDLEEELNTKTNPLLADTDGDSISDALEDTDNDGISNLREVTELKTDPLLVDTDADGLSDTYELVYKGSVAAFAPRIGDRLRFELRELVPQGTLKLVGTLPTGLTFNSVTGVMEGKLTGKAGLVKLSIQVLNGKTVLRTIPLQFTVLAFPSGLIGTWQVLLEDVNGNPQGMITTLISSPGVWSAQYDSLGTKTLRSSKGVFDLTPAMDRAAIAVSFPVVSLTPAFSSSWQIDATTALASGTYAQGMLRGFRLAKTGELPTASRQITMVIDQGEQDGYQIPAGLGWATGTLGTTGSLPLSGQLGDAQSLKTTVRLSATGQAMMWVKPYRNLNSLIGGIISLRDTGIVPQTTFTAIQSGLLWRRVADNAELSYSSGFGPLAADASVNLHNKPTSSLVFSANLGLSNSEFRNVVFDGGGLPNAEQLTAMPQRFVMDSTYKLNPVALPGRVMALWQGGIKSTAGSFTGTIALDASNSGILKGNASVSGVVFRRNELETVGAGLIKIPTTGLKGSFRTGAFLMER